MGIELAGKNEQKHKPNAWSYVFGAGGLAVGAYLGIGWGADKHDVTTFEPSECTEYSFGPGDRADNVAQELGANESGEVSSAIHETLDEQGYGRIEVCHTGDAWTVIDLDGSN